MRTVLVALLGSLVLATSALMTTPAGVVSKDSWPMTWYGVRSTRSTVEVGIRKGTDVQHQVAALAVRKRPGHDQRCTARMYLYPAFMQRPDDAFVVKNDRSRWKTRAIVYEEDTTGMRKGSTMRMKMEVRTNGHCQWVVVLTGPRVGMPET